ncbi:MAG: glycosyltransferase [Bacteroidetes bacterium]|nr:MAG: glycosyltransferase [Bacteroidota bacterium]
MTLISRLVFSIDKKTEQKSSDQLNIHEISIVIPVKDNQTGIDNFFDNFFKTQAKDTFPKEIIIVCNNSKQKTTIKKEFLDKFSNIKLLECKKVGPASARNLGVQHSTGKWILFVDSDCIPTETLISGYQFAKNGVIAYAGNVKSLKTDLLSNYYETQEILIPLKTLDKNKEFVPQYLITANCLVWKEAFEYVGGFNENITIAGGEDIDLGLRLSQIGDLSYAFTSIALHDFDDGIIGFWKRFKRYGKGNKIIEKLYQTDMKPELFRPNKRNFVNEVLAKMQWLALKIGYHSQK